VSTAGQVQGSRLFPLPDGSRLLVPVTTVTLADGAPLEGRGVTPDIPVERPLMYAAGEDPPMARAVQILAGQLACPEPLPPERFPHQDLTPDDEPADGGPDGVRVP
jgi:C-terminal processing protease CtpA/Prc